MSNPTCTLSSLSTGSCVAAGYEECCTEDSCLGEPQDCYCDADCFLFNDCCQDVDSICTFGKKLYAKIISLDLLNFLALAPTTYTTTKHKQQISLKVSRQLSVICVVTYDVLHWLHMFTRSTGDYLLFASHNTINHIDLNGENFNIFIGQLSGGAYGLNFHYRSV